MKRFTPLVAILIGLLSTAETCHSKQDVSPEELATSCFSNESLTTVSWQKDQLAAFQQPRSGPLTVVIYAYKNEHFLAFENAFDSGPAGHIFDCSGVTLGKRAINYNEFYGSNKKVKVLLEGRY